MISYIFEHLLILGVCIFAMRAGGLPERIAGAWLLANVSVFALASALEKQSPTLSLTCDAIFSIGLLPLAVYFVSWSVGVMCFIQTGSFLIQAVYLLNDRPADAAFIALTTVACWGVVTALFASTIASILHRRAKQRAVQPLAA